MTWLLQNALNSGRHFVLFLLLGIEMWVATTNYSSLSHLYAGQVSPIPSEQQQQQRQCLFLQECYCLSCFYLCFIFSLSLDQRKICRHTHKKSRGGRDQDKDKDKEDGENKSAEIRRKIPQK